MPMSDPTVEDLRSRARLLLIAAIATDLAAVATLVLPLLRGGDVTEMLPIALLLFVASSGLLVAFIGTKKKADEASGGA